MKRKTVDIITLGCSKNLVDSERLMAQFVNAGYICTHDNPHPQGEIVVVNTCGFIADAKEESVNMILELAQAKKEGRIKKLYVMGCLSERYHEELLQEIPQVDKYYGKFDWDGLLADLGKDSPASDSRILTTPRHYAYLKIAEGCNRFCSYCAIPLITGRFISRPMEDILEEVKCLVDEGVREFQVIAQELTFYGIDIYGESRIAELIERMAGIKGVKWIRLHYAYPAEFPMNLLKVIREKSNVCKYLDIALQHISDSILEKMHRHVTKAETYELLHTIRKEVPGIHLRTTLMVGYPGETETDFEELMGFVREMRFERMGGFAYSEEDGTYAAQHHPDDISQDVKQQRLDKLMALQADISAELNAEKVGKTMKVIIDRMEGDYYVGRSEFDSPEVDMEILIPKSERRLRCGCFYQVEIAGASEYELFGKVVKEKS